MGKIGTKPGWRNLVGAGVLLALAGCAPMVEQHGFIPDPELVERIRPGQQTRAQVAEILGAPSSVAAFNGETWYYISRRTETVAFLAPLAPMVVDQRVGAGSFNKDTGYVDEVRRFTADDMRTIDFVERETPTRGKELGFVEQLIGNVGRFNQADSGGPSRRGPRR
jgi:outer membrane protein assembly factor BamE (lipoprotein component of BamABCDE complex)